MQDIITLSETEQLPVLPENVPVLMPDLPLRLTINTERQFKAVFDSVRIKILGIVQNQPATAKQIAERLDASPGAIGHHLHVLEEAGLVQITARRLVHGIVANYFTRTARIFAYDLPPEITGAESISTDIITSARDELKEAIGNSKGNLISFQAFPHVRLTSDRIKVYEERLAVLVDDLLHEPTDPTGTVIGVLVSIFQSPAYMQSQQVTAAGTDYNDPESASRDASTNSHE